MKKNTFLQEEKSIEWYSFLQKVHICTKKEQKRTNKYQHVQNSAKIECEDD